MCNLTLPTDYVFQKRHLERAIPVLTEALQGLQRGLLGQSQNLVPTCCLGTQ